MGNRVKHIKRALKATKSRRREKKIKRQQAKTKNRKKEREMIIE